MALVCMITQSSYPSDPRVRRQAEVLEQAGHEVDVICIPQNNQPKVEKFGAVTAYRVMHDSRQERMVKYIMQSFVFFFLAAKKLKELSEKRNYKVIQVHNMPDFHIFIPFLQKYSGVKLVLDIHDLTPELFISKWTGWKGKILSPAVKFVEQRSCRFADEVITVTDRCKELLVERGVPQEKVTLVLNTPNRGIFRYDTNRKFDVINNGLRILYHGTVAERFGLHVAIKAMPEIIKKIPGSVFNIYGKYDQSYREKLESIIKELKLENNVFLHGRITLEQVYDIIKRSDIGVVPYLSNLYMNLALSTKTFEYAAAGLPIIATKLDSLALTFDDNCLEYVVDNDPADIAEKAVKLAEDPGLRKMKSWYANERLNAISWDVMADRYLRLMEKLMYSGDNIYDFNAHRMKKSKSVL